MIQAKEFQIGVYVANRGGTSMGENGLTPPVDLDRDSSLSQTVASMTTSKNLELCKPRSVGTGLELKETRMDPRGALAFCFSAALIFSILSCSSTIHREFSIDESPPKSMSVDARQRVILVTKHGGVSQDKHIVCAEPSPDVLATIAASFAAEGKVGMDSGKLSAASSEDAASIGRRTQTIQLLRDALYRACEAYMNGAISEDEYSRMLVGFDEMTITLLAIDGLTRRTQLPDIILDHHLAAVVGKDPVVSASAGEQGKEASEPNVIDTDPKLAAEIHEILKSYYSFQLEVKSLYMKGKGNPSSNR